MIRNNRLQTTDMAESVLSIFLFKNAPISPGVANVSLQILVLASLESSSSKGIWLPLASRR